MKINPSEIKETELDGDTELEISSENTIEELTEAVKKLTDKASWIKNIEITNKKEERERFKQARREDKDFKPEFSFRKLEKPEPVLKIIEDAEEAVQSIDEEELERYGAEKITVEEMKKFFKDILKELKLYTKLSAEIDEEEQWRKYSEEIWPMVNRETFQESVEKLKVMERTKEEKNKELDSEGLKQMFEEEIEELGMDYSAEIRQVGGCFNIPEEKKVVVADGKEEKRMYSRQEAEMLTKHELFHALRAHNGYTAGRESGFPPIIGIHTPFYDETEEGGALYREQQTETNYTDKDFDYHLRLVAAYKIANSDDYRGDFQNIVEDLIELGGSVERSFYLVARNREALRHHIYLNGVKEWKDRDEIWPLLIGKVTSEYAEMFREEVEAEGMIQEPDVGPDKVF